VLESITKNRARSAAASSGRIRREEITSLFQNFSQYLNETSPVAYVISYLGGVWASFTPCIYPVIPLLVGAIGVSAGPSRFRGLRLSLSFVVGMALTYAVLGLLAALTGKLFGQLTAHPAAYLIVGNVCLIFALSMLGLFEIRLPGSWGQARLGDSPAGMGAIFLMGASSGVIAAPCTVPVLGVLLTFVAQTRNVLFGFSLLLAFGLGLGTLLIFLGTFIGLVESLPKSGAWLERIKQAFGVLLILVAEYFFIQAGKRF